MHVCFRLGRSSTTTTTTTRRSLLRRYLSIGYGIFCIWNTNLLCITIPILIILIQLWIPCTLRILLIHIANFDLSICCRRSIKSQPTISINHRFHHKHFIIIGVKHFKSIRTQPLTMNLCF